MTDKKEHIVNVAIELFADRGFEGTSIRDLAAAAGVNIAMVNYYFGSKEKLFEAMVEYKSSFIREKLEAIVNDEGKSEIEKVDAMIDNYVDRLLTQHKYHRVIHHELMLQQREELHNNIINVFARNKEVMQAIIETGIKKKVFKPVDALLTIVSMLGTINQVLLSKPMCKLMIDHDEDFDPYTDPAFKERLTKHIKQLMHSHLLNN
ncbi:TetR/AcrR family transcriptional regulator [Chitinophagaceae bacterium LWZ2-11]